MNSEIIKYDSGQQKEYVKQRKLKKRLFLRSKAVLSAEDQELLRIAQESREEWIECNSYFEQANEEMLIDYYTYRIKASEARYAYILKLIKEKGLKS